MLKKITLVLIFFSLLSCNSKAQQTKDKKEYEIVKTEAQWKAELSELEFYVLRKAGTEPPFSSPLDKNYAPGTYHCRGCGTFLYSSKHKFDSGTGWPSFDRGKNEHLEFDVDYKIGYARTELKCANCGGHLGHKFDDGPRNTTGNRHCINGAALTFKPKKDDPK